MSLTENERIAAWQRELNNQPKVYIITDDDIVVSVYDSKEAAEIEMEWRLARKMRGFHLYTHHVQNLALSRERWQGGR